MFKRYRLHLLWIAAAAILIGCQGEGNDSNGTNGFNSGFTNGGATSGLTASSTGGGQTNGGNTDGGNTGGGNTGGTNTGGNTGGVSGFNITFANPNATSADTSVYTNPTTATGTRTDEYFFTGNAQKRDSADTRNRNITLTLSKNTGGNGPKITVGETYDADGVFDPGALDGSITYGEAPSAGGNSSWVSTGGTITVTGLTASEMTLELSGVTMVSSGAPATGTFTLSGTARFLVP